ncbi:hypothetical protein ACFPU0_23135 [Pseudomonas sp. GCM10022186]|uniref:hypothetical protein n=1 Tax=Pseudomonas sp. GCM10022186 TaxID=3252650 RepID=UPI00360DF15A
MADRGMGALEYRPVIERTTDKDDIDLTYAPVRGYADEHTTSFNGTGLATRKKLKQVCAPFRYLNPDIYHRADPRCRELKIDSEQQKVIQRAFDEIRERLG